MPLTLKSIPTSIITIPYHLPIPLIDVRTGGTSGRIIGNLGFYGDTPMVNNYLQRL